MGGWLQFGRGEVGWGRRRGRRRRNRGREEERVSAEVVYTGVYRRIHWRKYSIDITVGDFAGVSDMSLLGCLGLNPSVFPSVNSSEKNPRHPAVAIFKKNFTLSAMPPVYTDGIIPSVYTGGITDRFWDGIISVGKNFRRKISVGVIRFSGSEIKTNYENQFLINSMLKDEIKK